MQMQLCNNIIRSRYIYIVPQLQPALLRATIMLTWPMTKVSLEQLL